MRQRITKQNDILDTEGQYEYINKMIRTNANANLLFSSFFIIISLIGVFAKLYFFIAEMNNPFKMPQYLLLIDSSENHHLILFSEFISLICHFLHLFSWSIKLISIQNLKKSTLNEELKKSKIEPNHEKQNLCRLLLIISCILSLPSFVFLFFLTDHFVGSFCIVGITFFISIAGLYSLHQIYSSEQDPTELYGYTYKFENI